MTSLVESASNTPQLLGNWLSVLEDRLASADRVALCLDFDGTLAPVVEDPDDAAIPVRVERALSRLVDRPGFDVAVVSGRGLMDLRERVPVEGCALAGNHGLEIASGGDRWIHPEVADLAPALESVRRTVERRIASIPGCHLEDKRLTATVHFREAEVDRQTVGPLVAATVADAVGVEAVDGKQIVEIRPTVTWDKGDAVAELVDERATALYVGDDATDEDAFGALPALPNGGVGVLVGDRPSAASFRVHDVDGVRAFLEWLAESDLHGEASVPDAEPGRDATVGAEPESDTTADADTDSGGHLDAEPGGDGDGRDDASATGS